jgi:hypothetical protein
MSIIRLVGRVAVGVLLLAGAVIVLYVVAVLVLLGISAYQASADTSAMRGLIGRGLPLWSSTQQTLAFLRAHSAVALPFHHFSLSVDTQFEREPAYDPNNAASQVYSRGKALYASGESSGGTRLEVVFIFDPKGRFLRYHVNEVWFHAP